MRITIQDKHDNEFRIPSADLEFTRAEFLSTISLGTIAGLGLLAVKTDVAQKLADKPITERIIEESTHNRRALLSSFIESVAVWATNHVTAIGLEKLGIKNGAHAGDGKLYEEAVNKKTLQTYLSSNLFIPLMEEVMFRLIPSSFLDGKDRGSIRWDVGLTSNVIFALIHNFGNPEENKYTVSLTSIPLVQFVLGSYCWYAQRTGGFIHSAGAHILYNNLCSAYEAYENNKAITDTV